MPLIDLSTLDGPELRSLLDSARRQGQAAQSYEILQEMEARRQHGPRPKPLARKRRAPNPRIISVELGDPLDLKEDPLLAKPDEDLPPLTLAEPPPPERAPPVSKKQGWAHWGALIFALGLAGGVAGGWWAAEYADSGAPQAAAPAAPAAPPAVQTATLAPALPPANADAPVTLVPEPAAQTTQVPPPPPDSATAAAASASPGPTTAAPASTPAPPPPPVQSATTAATPTAPAHVAQATPDEPPAPVKTAQRSAAAGAAEAACGSEPADRTICADPKLRHLQTELRDAYAEALKAHEDKALLRQRELAWAQARNDVTDPDQLAGLYRERIAKLKAATAEALRLREAAPVSPRTAARPAQ